MASKKKTIIRITERDFLLANRKAAREEEILAHGKPITFRSHLQASKKKYNRKQMKKAITQRMMAFFIDTTYFIPLRAVCDSILFKTAYH